MKHGLSLSDIVGRQTLRNIRSNGKPASREPMTSFEPVKDDITILYVDDDANSRERICKIIRNRYPEVRLLASEDGKAGLETFKQQHPEIVITDINMPIINGIQMAADIKALDPSTEIIALTAHANTNHLIKSIEIGISHYILKPVDVGQLFKAIDTTISTIRSERVIAYQRDLILKINAELVQKTADLERMNRELESYDYTVAHDLRSPMVTINSFTRKLQNFCSSCMSDKSKEYLQAIDREIINLDRTVSVLLNFSLHSRTHLNKKWTNISKITHEICDNLKIQDPLRHVTFSISEDVYGFCDSELMQIVIKNLFENAWKYSANKNEARIEFGALHKEDNLVYFVRDNGIGFDMTASENIFIPFQRIHHDARINGLGIGLATVHRIIQRHGGRIWGEGETGKGATFYFTL